MVQGVTGLCEAWMPNASLQGRIYGVSRHPLTDTLTDDDTAKLSYRNQFLD